MIMCKNLDVASSKPSEIGSQSFLALEKDTNEQHTDFKKLGRSILQVQNIGMSLGGDGDGPLAFLLRAAFSRDFTLLSFPDRNVEFFSTAMIFASLQTS